MNPVKPTQITANKIVGIFTIAWSDGHVSHIPFSLLRHACPCAECRGGHENMSALPDPAIFLLPLDDTSAVHILNVEAVGSYALTIAWEDGHNYGIYRWDYLRALCPCPECRREYAG
jgi:DUF971 family protein